MGYLKPAETDQLTLKSDPAYWVRMKRRATWGDTSKAQAAMVQTGMTEQAVAAQAAAAAGNGQHPVDEATATAQVISEAETDAYMQTLVARLIVEWNLTDELDRPLAISVENVSLIEPEDGEFLAEEAQKRRGGRPAKEQRPFEKPSGQQSTATPSAIPKSGG